jgi:hypothetical protein
MCEVNLPPYKPLLKVDILSINPLPVNVKSKSTKETNSLFVSREQPIGGMTPPLFSASPGEPDESMRGVATLCRYT